VKKSGGALVSIVGCDRELCCLKAAGDGMLWGNFARVDGRANT
jgi:hypothetical protein